MKIKLIRLPTFFQSWDINSSELNSSLLPPLGPALITGYLSRRGFEIEQDDLNIRIFFEHRYNGFLFDQKPFFDQARIVDYCKGKQFDPGLDAIFQQLEEKCPVKGYEVILLSIQESLRNRSNVLFACAYAQYLKTKYQPFIMLGGFGVAVRLMYLEYDFPCIDFYVIGAGEKLLETVLKAKKEGRLLLSLDGVYYERNNRVLSSDYRKIEKPVFAGLPIEYYRYRGIYSEYCPDVKDIIDEFHHSQTLVMPFSLIKGCPHKCIFCSESNGKLDFIMDHDEAAVALDELQKAYNPAGYFFLDNEINVNQKYALNLCNSIINKGLKIQWSDCARADFTTKDILSKMKESGCIRLIFGIETGSRKLLEYVKKGVSLEQLESAIRWANELGIWTGIEIICGLPHESDQDIRETTDFLKRNKDYINRFYYNTFDLRGGSLLFHEPRKYGIENIFDVNEVVSFAERKYSKNFTQFGFDEIGGLRWEEKKKQTLSSYDKVVGAMGGYEGFPTLEEEHFLFFLYKKYGYDLEKIQVIFRRVAQEKGKYRDSLRRTGALI
ncbi:MAG: radical SAM protein [Candidatus Omnitrophota bacterium]|jgi:radical SAM superfamily enzyme YgiQ (UPF0313 family)